MQINVHTKFAIGECALINSQKRFDAYVKKIRVCVYKYRTEIYYDFDSIEKNDMGLPVHQLYGVSEDSSAIKSTYTSTGFDIIREINYEFGETVFSFYPGNSVYGPNAPYPVQLNNVEFSKTKEKEQWSFNVCKLQTNEIWRLPVETITKDIPEDYLDRCFEWPNERLYFSGNPDYPTPYEFLFKTLGVEEKAKEKFKEAARRPDVIKRQKDSEDREKMMEYIESLSTDELRNILNWK